MAQRSPTKLGTPRNRALDIGTAPAGFAGGIAYDPKAGVPQGTPGQGGKYRDPAEAAQPRAGGSNTQRRSFKTGGG